MPRRSSYEIVAPGGAAGGSTTFGSHAQLTVRAESPVLTVAKFDASDMLDFASFKFSRSEKLAFVENAGKTEGVLTITDGNLRARVNLFGAYTAADFHLSADHAGGTALTSDHGPS